MAESIIASPAPQSEAGARITYRRGEAQDLSRRSFGRWFVVDRARDAVQPSGRRRTMWNCVCRCGWKARVAAYSLVNGKTLSCGCLRAELRRAAGTRTVVAVRVRKAYGRRKEIDLTGERFGRWTVLEAAEDIITGDGQKRHAWSCECSCGTTKPVLETSLWSGKSRSCGCLRREVLPEARRLARLRRQVERVAAAS